MKEIREEIKTIISIYRLDNVDFEIEWQDEPEFDEVRDVLDTELFQKLVFIRTDKDWDIVYDNDRIFYGDLIEVWHTVYFMIEKANTDVYGACVDDCFNSVEDLSFDIINIIEDRITLQ